MREFRKNPNGPLPDPWAFRKPSPAPAVRADHSPYVPANPSPFTSNTSSSYMPANSPNTTMVHRNVRDATADERQAASMGKLVEVDLGPEKRLENIRRTEAAVRKLMGQDTAEDKEEEVSKGRKGGRGARGTKRRRSEDELRDQKVEEFMRGAPGTFPSSSQYLFIRSVLMFWASIPLRR
jgi:hypothetical protein